MVTINEKFQDYWSPIWGIVESFYATKNDDGISEVERYWWWHYNLYVETNAEHKKEVAAEKLVELLNTLCMTFIKIWQSGGIVPMRGLDDIASASENSAIDPLSIKTNYTEDGTALSVSFDFIDEFPTIEGDTDSETYHITIPFEWISNTTGCIITELATAAKAKKTQLDYRKMQTEFTLKNAQEELARIKDELDDYSDLPDELLGFYLESGKIPLYNRYHINVMLKRSKTEYDCWYYFIPPKHVDYVQLSYDGLVGHPERYVSVDAEGGPFIQLGQNRISAYPYGEITLNVEEITFDKTVKSWKLKTTGVAIWPKK